MKWILACVLLTTSLAAQSMEWDWLDEMRLAIQELDYQGEYLHRRGDAISTYSIAHTNRDGQAVELLRELDGNMIEVLREGNRVICFYPKGTEDMMGHPVPAAPFSQIEAFELQSIARSYQANAIGETRLVGRTVRILTLTSDPWRYQHKLWLDSETGLLLQHEIMDKTSRVLEQFRYTRIEIGVVITEAQLRPTLADSGVRQQTVFRPEFEAPDDRGFLTAPTWVPDNFSLEMTERQVQADGWLEKRVYSDGLATFSLYVEPSVGVDATLNRSAMGATSILMAQRHGYRVTVIGEIPMVTAERLLNSLEPLQ